jgi:hypothetical protein
MPVGLSWSSISLPGQLKCTTTTSVDNSVSKIGQSSMESHSDKSAAPVSAGFGSAEMDVRNEPTSPPIHGEETLCEDEIADTSPPKRIRRKPTFYFGSARAESDQDLFDEDSPYPGSSSSSSNTASPDQSTPSTSIAPFTTSSDPPPSQAPCSPTTLDLVSALPPVARFHTLLEHASNLVQSRGAYYISPSGYLSRAEKPRSGLAATRFAASLAAAQDVFKHGTLQPEGPLLSDLFVFRALWETTVQLLERMLDSGSLRYETFGWGIFGLSAGYLSSDSFFSGMKERLGDALRTLPRISTHAGERLEAEHHRLRSRSRHGRLLSLTRANRDIHICATMLLQSIRSDWNRVRWYHGIKVCEQWMAQINLSDDMDKEERVEGQLE